MLSGLWIAYLLCFWHCSSANFCVSTVLKASAFPIKTVRGVECNKTGAHPAENISIVASVAKRRFMIHLRSFLQCKGMESILCQLVEIGKVRNK